MTDQPTGRLIRVMTTETRERPARIENAQNPTVRSSNEAMRTLDDVSYFRWCRREADKFFVSLVAKRFPDLVEDRT